MRRHLAILALLVALAGCGASKEDDGVATAGGAGSEPTSSAAEEGDEIEQALAFSRCMRENGVPDFPDPQEGADGGIQLSLPDGIDPASVEAAREKCKQHLPNGGEPVEPDPEHVAQLREYAQCMRENGVPEFPDPDAGGGIAIEGGPGLDPLSEEFKAAEATCEDTLPAGGGERSSNTDGGESGGEG